MRLIVRQELPKLKSNRGGKSSIVAILKIEFMRTLFSLPSFLPVLAASLLTLTSSTALQAQQGYQPSPKNLEARAWFQEARFGLFVHWGVYSILGDGEWVMNNQNISKSEYEKLPQFFNPIAFDPNEWVAMVKRAGMKYITITSRHHDGFSMFDSKITDYDIVDASPYGKDILKQLAAACHREGIKLFFYYSLLDWNRDDYYPRGRT
jgi:alpha-L-fucosidase